MPAKKKPDTHNFLTRFPPKVWEQLEATASQAGIPANTMVVNYVSACLDAGIPRLIDTGMYVSKDLALIPTRSS